MISNESLELLRSAIVVFDELEGNDYLLAYSSSKKQPLNFLNIRIEKKNFWHLLGCKISESTDLSHEILYEKCFKGDNICQYLEYTSKKAEVKIKYNVFIQLFNFVEKARSIRLCVADPSQVFEIGAGNIKGLIGYSKKDEFYFPKTTQSKSIFEIDKNANNKIIYIIGKEIYEDKYSKLEYEIVEGVAAKSMQLRTLNESVV